MSKKILVINGSARKTGNTRCLSENFIKGLRCSNIDTDIVEVNLHEQTINDCIGCNSCQKNNSKCFQNDDMQSLYEEMKKSDVIVISSPVYFYTWNSITKRMIDRTFALEQILENKSFYLLSAGAAPEEKYMTIMIDSFTHYVSCFRKGGNIVGGYLFALGTSDILNLKDSKVIEDAYKLGLEIK